MFCFSVINWGFREWIVHTMGAGGGGQGACGEAPRTETHDLQMLLILRG